MTAYSYRVKEAHDNPAHWVSDNSLSEPGKPALPAATHRARATVRVPLRRRIVFAASTAAVMGGLWWVLTYQQPGSWAIGVPAVGLAAAVAGVLAPAQRLRVSPVGVVRFGIYFAIETLRGAVDVAWRALHPVMPLSPGFRDVELDLPEGPARIVFANAVTLLPGTLSVELRDDRLTVHTLDDTADLTGDLSRLQERVRGMFRRDVAEGVK